MGKLCISDDLRNVFFPVGSLYTSTKNTNPGTFMGGTWVAVTNDYILNFITSGTGGGVRWYFKHGF